MPRKEVIFAVIVVVAAAFLASIIFLIPPRGEEISTAEFEEFGESFIYIDADGNANCRLLMQLPPSQLSSFMKQITGLIGADVMTQSYTESIRSAYARYGLEVDNISCEVTGLGAEENFKVVLTWEIPNIARWSDNEWTINFNWVDNQSAAKETIAGEESTWILIRSLAQTFGIDVAFYRSSYQSVMVLPEGAENVYSAMFDSHEFTDYGGGSYGEGSVYLGQVDGRPAVIENGMTLTVTENEITITPQQLLEQYLAYTVSYEGISPENPSFIDSLEQVRLELKYGRELGDHYLIYSGGSWYSLSPAQVLYYAADAITIIDQNGQFLIQQPIENVTPPDNENGDWGASWRNLSKNEYVSLAQTVRDDIKSAGKAPGTIETPIGKIRFRDVLFTFTRILSSYKKNGELPSELIFSTVPNGELTRGDNQVPANYAYFLLPDTYVITDTSRVNEVLDNVYEVDYDNRKLAEEICNWTGTNLTYGLSFAPPTSEEVLVSREGQCRDYTNVYLALTRTAGMPARRVSGWVVSAWQPPAGWEFTVGTTPEGKTVASHAWVQVYLPDEGWVPLEPQSKKPRLYVGELPYDVYRQLEQTWMGALAGYESTYGVL